MGSLFGRKGKQRVPRPPPSARRAPPPHIIEVKRRFSAMKSKAMIYALLGAGISAAAGFAVNAALPSMPGLATGVAVAAATVFLYLAVNQSINAYSYYLYMRLKNDITQQAATPKAPVTAAPQAPPQPSITSPKPVPAIQTTGITVAEPEAPPIVSAPVKPVSREQPPAPPASRPAEPVIEIEEATELAERNIQPVKPAISAPQPLKPSPPMPRETIPQTPQPVQKVMPPASKPGGKKVCPYCGRELPYGDLHVICPYCGRRLK